MFRNIFAWLGRVAQGLGYLFRLLWDRAVGLFFDLLVIVGLASMSYGAWLIYHPLGFIVGGLFLTAIALLAIYNLEE